MATTLQMLTLKPTIWARFTDGTKILVWPGSEPRVMLGARDFGLAEPLFRMVVNSIDADVNEQPAD